jgi:hypothetical protein
MFSLRLAIGNSTGKRYLDPSAEFAELDTVAFFFVSGLCSFLRACRAMEIWPSPKLLGQDQRGKYSCVPPFVPLTIILPM